MQGKGGEGKAGQGTGGEGSQVKRIPPSEVRYRIIGYRTGMAGWNGVPRSVNDATCGKGRACVHHRQVIPTPWINSFTAAPGIGPLQWRQGK